MAAVGEVGQVKNRASVLKNFKSIVKSFSDTLTPIDLITLVRTISDLEHGTSSEEEAKIYDLDFLRLKVSLVEYAGQFLDLKKSGRGYVGNCPFHDDKTPSFYIYEDSNRYICFGCNKQGSIFDFIMEKKGVTFKRSVEEAARETE